MQIVKVTYADGRTEETRLTPRALCRAEEHAQINNWAAGDASRIRQSYYLAFIAMRNAGHTTLDFDEWMDTVEDIALEQKDPEPANPTL